MEKGHYEVSVAVAETHLLPAVRANPDAVVLADGMSCRVQLDDLADVAGDAPRRAARLRWKAERVNPRHRRLVIPWRWRPLLLIVVVIGGCWSTGERAAVRAASPRMRGAQPLLDPDALVRGRRLRAAEGRPAAAGAGSSCATSTSRPAGTCRSRRTTRPRRTPPTTPSATGRRGADAVDDLLDEPFGNWHVETTTQTHQLRVTKKREALRAHHRPRPSRSTVERGHDRDKDRLLPEDDPLFRALGLADAPGPAQAEPAGQVPPGRGVPAPARRRRSPTRSAKGHLRRPTAEDPLRVVDLGCGNAYLTFAAAALPRRGPRAAGRG